MKEAEFQLVSDHSPAGDQPQAIEALIKGLDRGDRCQTLLGVTGSGKTYTMANVIAAQNRPALVMAHNKTLAAQLYNELKAFFPHNAVEYFISYYDYYQPEAYNPKTNNYVEKQVQINDDIDRMRHSATRSLFERRDVIVVASVSCIYGLGLPQNYLESSIRLFVGQQLERDALLTELVRMHYLRNDVELSRSTFRARGDVVELHPAYEDCLTRIEFFGDEIERISIIAQDTGEVQALPDELVIYPAIHYVADPNDKERAMAQIRAELEDQLRWFYENNRPLEAQRLDQRTSKDLEMIKELGYCNGIENYSRIFEGRQAGQPPKTLIDYFPADFLFMVDESHVTLPQLRGMYHGDRARKDNLIQYGFRLPCARDNRPLTFEECWDRIGQTLFISATPGTYELEVSAQVVEQIIRPTGLLDPSVEVRGTQHQVDDLLEEIRARVDRKERVLITTLTKRMAEDLSEYYRGLDLRVQYLHSDIKALERVQILRDLRLGHFDVLIGVNLLREGLDLPEVTLVAIMDADKEGFLRSESSLIQIIGRAARNVYGQVILYADKHTAAMTHALEETNRRRALQEAYNQQHGIEPKTIIKAVDNNLLSMIGAMAAEAADQEAVVRQEMRTIERDKLPALLKELEIQMHSAAKRLDFEQAARLRDQWMAMKKIMHDEYGTRSSVFVQE
ncbi:MAG: excinuclease ABC subunit UvrB [Cyanobacteria bacterium HKST-UBA04]|nr:excinuclease ABC subunit UvrB [Cyanobacteria bacterium HKST-UBA04]